MDAAFSEFLEKGYWDAMITLQHGILHREQTIAGGGDYCDYYITGNRE